MVYTFLPFAILPIYAAAEKFDFRLIEAARDLGARPVAGASVGCSCPASGRGLFTAMLIVFIPALGSYVIPDIVGGPGAEMLGNKIAQRVFVDRNLPHASGLSLLLILALLLPLDRGAHSAGQKRKGRTHHRGRRMKRSRLPLVITACDPAVFFYLPILVLVVNSFNSSRFGGSWEGFSLYWYSAAAVASGKSGMR